MFATLPEDTAGSLTYSCTASPAVSFEPSAEPAGDPFISLPSGNHTVLPFYGRIFAGQDVAAGLYVDVVTITLNF